MEQVSSNRLRRAAADLQGNDEERSRLLGRLAVRLGGAALIGGAAEILLWLFGIIEGQNFVPAALFSSLLMCAVAAVTFSLIQRKRFKLATNVFLYTTVL